LWECCCCCCCCWLLCIYKFEGQVWEIKREHGTVRV
jgi:hypothetical protein